MIEAFEKWPESQEPNETVSFPGPNNLALVIRPEGPADHYITRRAQAFALANNTQNSIYEVIGADPVRTAQFAGAMKTIAHFPGYGIPDLVQNYDWAALGNALIVDLGGSQGYVAMELAQNFPEARLIVQDMGRVIKGAKSIVPDQLKERVQFMAHELFEPQTVEADVYLFRMVFHNWSDKYCVIMLRAQIPALRPGAKILIQDACMPNPNTIPLWKERELRYVINPNLTTRDLINKTTPRAMDLNMGAFFNSRERYLHEWKALLAEADGRFVLQRVIEPEGHGLAILEIGWDESILPRS